MARRYHIYQKAEGRFLQVAELWANGSGKAKEKYIALLNKPRSALSELVAWREDKDPNRSLIDG